MSEDEALGDDEVLALLDDLLDGCNAIHEAEGTEFAFWQRGERPHLVRFASIYALCAHVLISQARPHLDGPLMMAYSRSSVRRTNARVVCDMDGTEPRVGVRTSQRGDPSYARGTPNHW